PLVRVGPAPLAALGGRDRLAVDAPGRRRPLLALRPPDLLPERVVDQLQGAVVPPLVEVPPDGGLGREVLGQESPLAAGPQHVEDGGHDIPQVRRPRAAARVDRDQPGDQPPLRVGHVAGYLLVRIPATYGIHPLWDRLSNLIL